MNNNKVLKPLIKYQDGAKKIEKTEKGDWWDVFANETVIMYKGDHRYISLGFAMQLPEGYEAHVAPRSSTFKNWGILVANSVGVIDNSYKGNDDIWALSAYCAEPRRTQEPKTIWQKIKSKLGFAERYTIIRRGDRIAQIRLVENMPKMEPQEVYILSGENRTGFGHTGMR